MPAWDKEQYEIRNTTRDMVLASRSGRASNMVSRGFGLMMHKSLPIEGALIIEPCHSIVSFFMRFPFDAVFVGKDGRVLHTIRSMRAWRASSLVRGSAYVIELPAGTVERTETGVGDLIEWSPTHQ